MTNCIKPTNYTDDGKKWRLDVLSLNSLADALPKKWFARRIVGDFALFDLWIDVEGLLLLGLGEARPMGYPHHVTTSEMPLPIWGLHLLADCEDGSASNKKAWCCLCCYLNKRLASSNWLLYHSSGPEKPKPTFWKQYVNKELLDTGS